MRELDMSNACLVSDPGIPTLEKALDPTVLRSACPRSCPRSGGRSETFDSKFSSTTRAVRLKDQLSFLEGCWPTCALVMAGIPVVRSFWLLAAR